MSSVQLQTDEVDWKAAPANATSEDTWMTVSECESGCLYGLDDTLSGGSVGLSTRVRSCPPDQNCQRVSVHYQACNAIQKCAGRKKITVTQFADDVCQQAARRQPQLLLPRGTQQVSSDAGRACQVWCYLNAGGMFNPHGRTFPDGTRCHTGLTGSESKAHFCLSGRCQASWSAFHVVQSDFIREIIIRYAPSVSYKSYSEGLDLESPVPLFQ